MIAGIGIDICDTEKLKKAMKKKRFIDRVFDEKEVKYCGSKKKSGIHFAGRFAVKEAFIKAVSNDKTVGMKDVVVVNNKDGMPRIVMTDKIKGVLRKKRAKKASITISHTDNAAAAVCVLER